MKDKFKKYFTQRNRNIISIFIIIFGLIFIINYSFFRPTYINKYIATNIYKAPANSAFTDQIFYNCVIDNYNNSVYESQRVSYTTNLSDKQLNSMTYLNCDKDGIANTVGLSKLTKLKHLNVDRNQLTSLDVSKNAELEFLSVWENQITTIDVSKNLNLTDLRLEENQLTSLDVSKNTMLEYLDSRENQLTSLDVSKNTKITQLYVQENQLTTLDVSKNTKLAWLNVSSNKLTTIDLSKNPELRYLAFSNSQLTTIDVSKNPNLVGLHLHGNQLTTLNISKNLKLEYLSIEKNQLTAIDVSNAPNLKDLSADRNQLTTIDLSKNPELNELYIYDNQLMAIDVSKNPKLERLYTQENQITTIDLSKNPELYWLQISSNQLTSLDVSKNLKLKYLQAWGNQLTSLLTANPELTSMEISGNKLTIIDVSKDPKLESLTVSGNQLTTIDVSKNANLKRLSIYENKLTTLDLSGASSLIELSAHKNQLTSLVVSNNTKLTKLSVGDNNLTKLNLSGAPNLKDLSAYGNQITTIDVSKNLELEQIDIWENRLTKIDLSGNPELTSLSIEKNQLTSLDLSKNPKLNFLNVAENKITSLDLSKNPNLHRLTASGLQKFLDLSNQTDWERLNLKFDVKYYHIYDGSSTNYKLSLPVKLDSKYEYVSSYTSNGSYYRVRNFTWSCHRADNLNCDNSGNVVINGEGTINVTGWASVYLNTDVNDFINGSASLRRSNEININAEVISFKLTSNHYLLSDDASYIFVDDVEPCTDSSECDLMFTHTEVSKIINSIDVPEGIDVSISSDYSKLIIHPLNDYQTKLKEINVVAADIDSLISYEHDDEKIFVNYGMPYNSFMNGLSNSGGVTFELYNGNNRVSNGTISNGMTLKAVYNNTTVKQYTIDTTRYTIDLSDYSTGKNYILLKNNETINTSTIEHDNCSLALYDDRLEILQGDNIVDTYKVIKIIGNYYFSGKSSGYMYVGGYTDEEILSGISIPDNKVSAKIENNKLIFYLKGYGTLWEFDLLRLNIVNNGVGRYEINEKDRLIFVDSDTDYNTILSNLSLSAYYGAITIREETIDDKTVPILYFYRNNDITSYKIYGFSTNCYSFGDDYIYIGYNPTGTMNMLDFTLFNLSGTKFYDKLKFFSTIDGKLVKEYDTFAYYIGNDELEKIKDVVEYLYVSSYTNSEISNKIFLTSSRFNSSISDNKIKFSYNGETLEERNLIRVTSDDYIFVGNKIFTNGESFDIDKVNVNVASKEISNGKLIIKYHNIILEEFDIIEDISFGNLSVSGKNIYLPQPIPYDDFVSQINVSGDVSFELVNSNNVKVTSGNIGRGIRLLVKSNDSLVETLYIFDEYTDISQGSGIVQTELNNNNNALHNISPGTSISDLYTEVTSSGEKNILNKDDEVVVGENYILKTGDTLNISSLDGPLDYKIIVKGDLLGDGAISKNEAKMVGEYLLGSRELTEEQVLASNYDNNDNVKLNDIIKMMNDLKAGNG